MTALAFLTHMAFGFVLAVLSGVLTWVLMRRVRILDAPNERSSHSRPTPRSGGIAIVVTFFTGLAGLYVLGDAMRISEPHFIGFVAAAMAIAAISIVDDLHGMGFMAKLTLQAGAAVAVMAFGVTITHLQLPVVGAVDLGWAAWPLTLIWIVGLTNAYNFMDGLDGFAGSSAVVAAFFFAMITFLEGSAFIYLASMILGFSTLGFLFWNYPPAKIFMGDSGSQFIGFVLAVMAVIAGLFDTSQTSFYVMPLLFFHYIWDTAFTLARRILARERVTRAHRSHLYQLMNRLGASHRQVTLFNVAVMIAQGLGALVLVSLAGEMRLWVFAPFIAFQVVYTWLIVSRARQAGLLS